MQKEWAPVAVYNGLIAPKDGWTFEVSEGDKIVYIPFEGYYRNRGGTLRSPMIELDKTEDEQAFYMIRAKISAEENGYIAPGTYDKNGEGIPCNTMQVRAGKDVQNYEELFFASPGVVKAQLMFIAEKGLSVSDVSLQRVSLEKAVAWCDSVNRQIPEFDYKAPVDPALYPESLRKALHGNGPYKILFLGDSIVCDSYHSNFQALFMKAFPEADVKFNISVRGSTGCWYYREPEHFKEYVSRFQPDLVMIGGISNIKETPEEDMSEVIRLCKEAGYDVIIMTPAPSYEWRTKPGEHCWQNSLNKNFLRWDFQRAAAAKANVPLWDMTTMPCTVFENSPHPSDWFHRDTVHNNDNGKQVIGRTLMAYFQAAYDCK